MADSTARELQYVYKANSNLVLQADRSLIDRRSKNEATGEVMPIDQLVRFGDRAVNTTTHSKKRPANKSDEPQNRKKKSGVNIFEDIDNDDRNTSYRPITSETKHLHEMLLSIVNKILGSYARDILYTAADEVLKALKSDEVREKDRRSIVQELLGNLDDESYSNIVSLCKRITDWEPEDHSQNNNDSDEAINLILDDDEEEEVYADEVDEEVEDDDEEEKEEESVVAQTIKTNSESKKSEIPKNKSDLHPRNIDAHWLQRKVRKYVQNDSVEAKEKADEILKILSSARDNHDVQMKLIKCLGSLAMNFITMLRDNRNMVLYCTLLAKAQNDSEKLKIMKDMKSDPELRKILESLEETNDLKGKIKEDMSANEVEAENVEESQSFRKILDLNTFTLQGSHFNTSDVFNSSKVKPETTQRNGYYEVLIKPTNVKNDNDKLIKIDNLPTYAQGAFQGIESLNRVQSRICKAALESDDNLLLCAPTGAGKTNVALLTMLREIGRNMNKNGTINKEDFKIVYIAPMKSLVQEMATSFGERLESYGLKVEELTGDHQLTKEQITNTQIIVCTPEKWDIATRQGSERTFTKLVHLVIIDEIHLLHDDRGPILEAIVARMIRNSEATQEPVRIIGLSATLPNYEDVALFLRVPKHGVFYFGNEYRPVPLQQSFIGFTDKNAMKKLHAMNEVLFEKVIKNAGKHQTLVFVHSRKATAETAKNIREMFLKKETTEQFLLENSSSKLILEDAVKDARDQNLQNLLPHGFAIHHAGMDKNDRKLVEQLFREKHIQVLVSTATLAWGVNLPAHTVIIKGTQIYNPEQGKWVEIGVLDVMQMMGRAGRPQHDKSGEGILMTNHKEIHHYLNLMNEEFPIESKFVNKLTDNLNAEIVLGTVRNVKDAVKWLEYTYLYVRLIRAPHVYDVPDDYLNDDPKLENFRSDLIHTAASILEKSMMIMYDSKSGNFQVTDLGRIASYFYITHESMAMYQTQLKESHSEIDLFRIFSLSSEFKHVKVRGEEKQELERLLDSVPITIKESVEEPAAKVNVLLQVYISQLKLDGFILMADMSFVSQSALRLMRAIFEVAMAKKWARLTKLTLAYSKMVERKMWGVRTPLRQFDTRRITKEIESLEKKTFPFERLLDLDPHEVADLIKTNPKNGNKIYRMIQQIPKLKLEMEAHPINRSTLKIDLAVTPDFQWNINVHGQSQAFWIFVEDVDGEKLLHQEYFLIKERYHKNTLILKFFVEVNEPISPYYYIHVISDKWLGSESSIRIELKDLIFPEKYVPPTELLDLQKLPISALENNAYENLYAGNIKHFNSIQTQVFNAFYNSDDNVFLGAPTGSGKTICMELAILKMFTENSDGKCLLMTPIPDLAQLAFNDWKNKFEKIGKKVVLLTGDVSIDHKLISRGNIIITTPEVWYTFSRRVKNIYTKQDVIIKINLVLIDEIHHLGGENGPIMEMAISWTKYIFNLKKSSARIIAVGSPIANAKDVAQWLKCDSSFFNFHPGNRPLPLDTHTVGFNISHNATRNVSMIKPVYNNIMAYAPNDPVIVFVPSRELTETTACEFITLCAANLQETRFLHVAVVELMPYINRIQDETLKETVGKGIGFLHEGLCEGDRYLISQLFKHNTIQVLIVSKSLAWSLENYSKLVIIMDTQSYNGKLHTYGDYPIADMLHMIGRANRPGIDKDSKAVILCQSHKKEVFKKFLHAPLPIESHLDRYLHDHFLTGINSNFIGDKQAAVDFLTWSFYFFRLKQNPMYYGLEGNTDRHLNDHLSKLVENTLDDLETVKCINADDFEVSIQNLGLIANYYSITHTTMDLFNLSLSEKTKLNGLIQIICKAAEFETIPIRRQDDAILQQLANQCPIKLQNSNFSDPYNKIIILLQAHLSRKELSPELQSDTEEILSKAIPLIHASVDVLSTNGWYKPTVAAMELSQMITQAVWKKDSYLKQLPHFSEEVIKRFQDHGIDSIFDFIEMDREKREELLQMTDREKSDVAKYSSAYPNMEFNFQTKVQHKDDYTTVKVTVTIERDEEMNGPVMAPFFPRRREEEWWIVIGKMESNELVTIKRVPELKKSKTMELEFIAPSPGKHSYDICFISDSYMGCDHEYKFDVDVQPEAMDCN